MNNQTIAFQMPNPDIMGNDSKVVKATPEAPGKRKAKKKIAKRVRNIAKASRKKNRRKQ